MLHDCRSLLQWHDMCSSSDNLGLGPSLSEDLISSSAWFNTNQFMLDLIFFHRMRRYPCLTNHSSRASAIYVPFFAGLDTGRYLFDSPNASSSARDALALDLADWLVARPEWAAMGGRDHFLVCGRITWDFRRKAADVAGWGSALFGLPAVKNMTRLLIERDTADDDEFGVPYPTYFHPSRDEEVFEWQGKLRVMGGHNCTRSRPPGDSFTRRSVFDSMLAGCIPVFFYTETAYAQYNWHLPGNHTSYSVFIPEAEVIEGKVDLEERLSGIGMEAVEAMREELIRMVPRLVYADPRGRLEAMEDAFDVAVKGVIERVEMLRREREETNA
ncbi:Xyloglucan galactosyltransferase KATAMARI1 [Acorus calamus]|uniref:Xyloglucan galactosyltransferase KATAMARI1 n=1 Tax=Acorus calamus TaxID=4465 RepID=A0AAV9F6I0_ACOCL|nr:Xyloglucan galactosyltransferase KATAMARI1 [Acorus calamus]